MSKHDVINRVGKFLGRAWALVRQILSVRALLQWTGWWETVTAAIVSVSLAVASVLTDRSWPMAAAIAIGVFAAVSICWHVWMQAWMVWRARKAELEVHPLLRESSIVKTAFAKSNQTLHDLDKFKPKRKND